MTFRKAIIPLALLCLIVGHSDVRAETGIYKDWIYDTTNTEFYFAATYNQATNVLGQYCYFEMDTCIYLIDIDITCEQGSEYPVLVNSNIGAFQITFICGHVYQNKNVLYASDFNKIDEIINQASKVGFAIPLKNDRFKVSRFSLLGSAAAIERMLLDAKKRLEGGGNYFDLPDSNIL